MIAAHLVAEHDVGVDLHACGLRRLYGGEVLLFGAVLGAHRTLLIELTEVEEVVDAVAGV